ncbi:MAG TPA: 1-acyl-sn-glycerol-3-phosphate acyltransferase [Alphaproteobacteria bacterium]|nr:1-acyl-sn-glycerol-3-phosphate acyltransferase [Alphaproteobacteria bacterium]
MTGDVTLPLWLVLIAGLLALWAILARILVPGVRWMLKRRVNRLIEDLNQRLPVKIPPFALAKRQALIDRLCYDPQVLSAVETESVATGKPRALLMDEVQRYAREIVPAFNAYLYFRIGYWLARRIARSLYRVRLGFADEAALAAIPAGSTLVFVMNHRSNFDYVLVAFLAADRTALSYAVGEWARIWPLQTLIRALGAYFVRRNSGRALYRRVLESYVGMAVENGVAQAIYPEGGLSRDGRLRPPRLGLIDYMLKAFDPNGPRDLVFVPVGINYDRVLEDRSLLLTLDAERPRKGRLAAIGTSLRFVAHNLRLMAAGRWYRFGYACVNFGTPVSARDWIVATAPDLRRMAKEERLVLVERFASELMRQVAVIVPVLPVSLVATVILREPHRTWTELDIKVAVKALMDRLARAGAKVYVPRGDEDYAVSAGLRMLTLRRLVRRGEDGLCRAAPAETALLAYYANAIAETVALAEPAGDAREHALAHSAFA